ncbi:putative TetR family transcriptional regulator [Sphingobium sp. SYK-6]|uniref:TetR/AcrR family transcriptional regulator n=1 Tax=Sphingobium sp. (strain NBRC 103272 / SYK-6) TaxID=627192 RepID=UPI0002277588|nr:TetR/AcrR family transcriptional regulator [Sphingobium sp. SYK-6]BAK67181.1 putative TetR family transcriptional regulator [Sphingobium sp. SYK-6]
MAGDLEEQLRTAGAFPAQQQRSKQMRDALLETGLALARRVDFEDLSVARICADAGCSTGAFYARFPDKVSFFKALIIKHAMSSRAQSQAQLDAVPFRDMLGATIRRMVRAYLANAIFLRSAVKVSLEDPEAWEPFRRNSHELANYLLERIRAESTIDQASVKEPAIRFAVQMLLAALNNSLLNRPGPVFLEDEMFPVLLEDAVEKVMGLRTLEGAGD